MGKKVIIYKAPPKQSRSKETFISLTMSLLLGCLVFVTLFLFKADSLNQSLPTKVYSAQSDDLLFSPTLLTATPSAEPEMQLPLLTGDTWTATPAANPTPPEDYCMDVPMLMYHHVQPLPIAQLLGHPQLTVDSAIFEEQMKYLIAQGYTFISTEELVSALINYQPLPAKPVVITIDDGYDDNYTYAFLIAKKYNIVMNFMIPSALIDKPGYMMWDHVKEMNASPYAKIYNHTATHAALGLISPEEIDGELSSSSAAFKEQLGSSPNILVYPYGSFNDLAIEKAKQHGFIAAISTIDGRMQCRSQIMDLPRTRVGNTSLSEYGL